MQYRRWCFTLNNPTQDERARIARVCQEPPVSYAVIGREEGEEGTPHLQGFICLAGAKRLSWCRRSISDRAHFEQCRGSVSQNQEYCKKDGDFDEYGTPPTEPAKRNSSWERFRDWLKEREERPSDLEIVEVFPGLYGQYRRGVRDIVDLFFPPPPPLDVATVELRDWQRELNGYLDGAADDRTIKFIVDEQGGSGKSFFSKFVSSKYPTRVQCLRPAKRDDLAHAVDASRDIFVFDVPRGGMEYFQYSILEQLKDRAVFSPKYESGMKFLPKNPYVIVMCNEQPDRSKLTLDRYSVTTLTTNTHNILN